MNRTHEFQEELHDHLLEGYVTALQDDISTTPPQELDPELADVARLLAMSLRPKQPPPTNLQHISAEALIEKYNLDQPNAADSGRGWSLNWATTANWLNALIARLGTSKSVNITWRRVFVFLALFAVWTVMVARVSQSAIASALGQCQSTVTTLVSSKGTDKEAPLANSKHTQPPSTSSRGAAANKSAASPGLPIRRSQSVTKVTARIFDAVAAGRKAASWVDLFTRQ